MAAGFLIAGAGILASAVQDVPPGATIVLIGVACFVATAAVAALVRRLRRTRRLHLPPEGEPLEVELPRAEAAGGPQAPPRG
jgi:zinc transport system permease protein